MFSRLSELSALTLPAEPVAIEVVTEARRQGDLADMIEKWCDMNKLYHFEGPRGEQNFEKLVRVLGYRSLSDFLEDNSGAYQAMIEWLGTQSNSEWVEAFQNEGVGADDEESDDEDDDAK